MAKKIKKEAPKPSSPAWMATFSDLMALLLTFFVLLFSFSTMDMAKWASIVSAFTGSYSIQPGFGLLPLPDLSSLQVKPGDIYLPGEVTDNAMDAGASSDWEELFDILSMFSVESGGVSQVVVLGTQEYITIRLPDALLFESGLAVLRVDSQPRIRDIWAIIRNSMHIIGTIRVEGHTCDIALRPNAAFRDNWDLSQARANVVGRFLFDLGLEGNKAEMVGRGEFYPLYPNDSLANREKNRRVDIILVRDLTASAVIPADDLARLPMW